MGMSPDTDLKTLLYCEIERDLSGIYQLCDSFGKVFKSSPNRVTLASASVTKIHPGPLCTCTYLNLWTQTKKVNMHGPNIGLFHENCL